MSMLTCTDHLAIGQDLDAQAVAGAAGTEATGWAMLGRLAPPQGVAVVGAGGGHGDWLARLHAWGLSRVLLVEGEPDQFLSLQTWQRRAAPDDVRRQWTLSPSVVGREGAQVEFHRASLKEASGVVAPAAWTAWWPNIRSLGQRTVPSTGLDALLQTFGACNWLLIDCLPARAVFEGAADALEALEVVAALVTTDPGRHVPGADLETTQVALAQRGFRLASIAPTRHPRLARAYFLRDYRSCWQRAQAQAHAERETAGQRLAEMADRCAQSEQTARQRAQDLEQLAQVHERTRELIVQQPAEFARQAEARQDRKVHWMLRQMARASAELTAQLQAQQTLLAQTVSAGTRQDLTDTLGVALDRMGANVARQQANAVRQIESFIGIQNFLGAGHGLNEFHGWPISPDLGVFLLQSLAENAYDLVVEFGSGTSTAMFARAVEVIEARGGTPGVSGGTRILSFDHDAHYFQRTTSLLASQCLTTRVDLQHAPLAEQTWAGRPFRFYDCAAALAAVEQAAAGRTLRVLVLVDGPPAKTCPLARFPALPMVMSQLGRHAIDIVLDDYHRAEEREVVAMWKAMLQAQGRAFLEQTLDCEKGAVRLSLSMENPTT